MILIAAVKGYTNRYFSKLCKYTFTGNNVTCEFYYYDQVVVVDSGIKVGQALQTCYAGIEDRCCDIECPTGIAGPPTVIHGTWAQQGGSTIIITWSTGGVEMWATSPNAWTLMSASYCPTDCWGWGFETDPVPGQLDRTKSFVGKYQRYNGWSGVNESLMVNEWFDLGRMKLTDTGALRYVDWDVSQRLWVHSYMAFVADRVIYQISHDFDNDGKISKGHTYIGFPIFKAGIHRGFVFADASEVAGGAGTFGAIYYYG